MISLYANQYKKIIVKRVVLLSILGTFTLSSCEYLVPKTEEKKSENVLAEVGDYVLYESDLDELNYESGEDSTEVVERFINNWVKRKVLLQKAESNLDLDELDIDRKVNNFRYELIVYEFKKQYLEQNLSQEISEKEISEYYDNNKSNFELKQNIVKCYFLKFPLNTPKINKAKKWFYSTKESDFERLKDFSQTYAITYSFEDSLWVRFDELALNTPLMSVPNKTDYLRQHKNIITSDSSYIYFFRINDYKLSNDISPLEFVKENIQNILLSKKRKELLKALEKEIYEQAEREEKFKIY